MQKLKWMDLYWLVDGTPHKRHATWTGSQVWNGERLLGYLVLKGIVRVVLDKDKRFKEAEVLVNEKIDSKYIFDLLWRVDWKKVKKLKVKK